MGHVFFAAIVISIIAWITQLYTFVWGSEAVGVHMTMAGYLTMLLAINLTFLVRATPGNVGIFQVVYVFTAAQFGVPKEQAIAVSLLIQTIQVVPITVLGVVLAPEFIFRRGIAAKTL